MIEPPKEFSVTATAEWVSKEYFPNIPVKVEHLRSVTNDVYIVNLPKQRFILKVYGLGWRNESAIKWEVQLLDHLSSKNINLAKPIRASDGKAVKTISTRNEQRNAVLFEYVPGNKPQPPFTTDLYYTEGRAVGALHAASDDFTCNYQRPVLDLAYLVDAPIESAVSKLKESDREFLTEFGNHIKAKIMEANEQGLDWGPCHGDMTLDNLHVTDNNEIYFYDFDSGGMGWRASDIQGWAISEEDEKQKRNAFLRGYREVRDLSTNDEQAAIYLHAAWEIWGLSNDFTKRIATKDLVQKYMTKHMNRLRSFELALKAWEKHH